jgi:hypothetical protein
MTRLATFDYEPWTEERNTAAWERIWNLCDQAVGMCYDGCHKIYILLDDETAERMVDNEYSVITANYDTIREWYEEYSCSLRFVEAIKKRNEFESVIPQLMLVGDENES